MVKVTFLGTGAAFTTNRRTNVALLVQEDDVNFMLECGPTAVYQLDQACSAADQINYLFISHRHGDHILGLPSFLLLHSLGGAPGTLNILGSTDVVQVGQELVQLAYPELTKRLSSVNWVDLPVDQASSMELGSALKFSTLPVPHSTSAPVLALRLEFQTSGRSVVYTGDTIYNEETSAFAAGCDLLVHEANFSETLHPGIDAASYGHSTARQAGLIASHAQCRILALVHLSPDYTGREDKVRADAAQEFDGQIIIPSDGATIYL
jgi:ribonuclease Z